MSGQDNQRTLTNDVVGGGLMQFNGPSPRGQWLSSPELRSEVGEEDYDEDVCGLYENLLKGVDSDMDAELTALSEVTYIICCT